MAVAVTNDLSLDYILFDMVNGSLEQKETLEAWTREYGLVKVRPNEGGTFKVRHAGVDYSFPPKGTFIDRRLAIELLLDWGREGTYRYFDQATGFTEDAFFALPEEIQKRYDYGKQCNFETRYLTHITQAAEEAEKAGEEGSKAAVKKAVPGVPLATDEPEDEEPIDGDI